MSQKIIRTLSFKTKFWPVIIGQKLKKKIILDIFTAVSQS